MIRAHFALVLAGAMIAAPVSAYRIEYTPDETKQCAEQGGCAVYSMLALRELAAEACLIGRANCPSGART